ncbi:hypothetical protein ACLBV5_10025 [Brevundimonas sp. M1A4_2e]|uniref:Uncharacterized protein n=1 Tax=Brevundimonas naejangsanensis TaxID=588932 RepID=A0A172Y2N8_9CAUL|nr:MULTISPECIES: hypothetical protein [Brevundimonas]ANF53375.1 hypothetical protein DA69_00450 [Brevundimonas naejangsanensis]MCB7500515.1 hypothetical protein [Enterobacter roggenkampii]QBQ48918.1 hypothetical protein E3U41_09630 [Brevundimonas naejangsanensis]
MPDQDAFEVALEEAIALFEQGENMNQARFDELIAELEARRPALHAVAEDDPRAERARELERRAAELEHRAAQGHGQMDEVNSLLSPLMGKKSET